MSNSLPSVKSWYGSSDASAGLVVLLDLVSFASSSPKKSGSSGGSIFTGLRGWGSFFLGLAMRPRLGCFFFFSVGEVGGSVSELVSGFFWSCARYHWFSSKACSFSSTLGTRLVGFGFGETTLFALQVAPGGFLQGGMVPWYTWWDPKWPGTCCPNAIIGSKAAPWCIGWAECTGAQPCPPDWKGPPNRLGPGCWNPCWQGWLGCSVCHVCLKAWLCPNPCWKALGSTNGFCSWRWWGTPSWATSCLTGTVWFPLSCVPGPLWLVVFGNCGYCFPSCLLLACLADTG